MVDSKDAFPVKNTFYNILKTIHFFYQKRLFINSIESLTDLGDSEVAQVCKWLISLIQNDEKSQNFIKRLTDIQEYSSVNYYELFIRASDKETTSIEGIFYALNDENGKPNRIGLNELMRLFFSQKEQTKQETKYLENAFVAVAADYQSWFCMFAEFANDYQSYYYDKYENKETGLKPYNKYLKQVLSIPIQSNQFSKWFDEATENTNSFLEKTDPVFSQKWSDTLFYNPQGESNIGFARFILQFSMLKTYYQSLSLQIAI